MTRRATCCAALAMAGLVLPADVARSQDRLDLSVEPGDVAESGGAHLDLSDRPPGATPPGPREPGWSVRPEVELELRHDETGEGTLGTIDPELESLGMRLKRTW